MNNEEIIDKLSELQNRIKATFGKDDAGEDNAWFFPKSEEFKEEFPVPDVKGYFGTEEIMFIGLNPSKKNQSVKKRGYSPEDVFLYSQLKEQGFQNAHITDFIKERLKTESKIVDDYLNNKEKIETNLRFLREEIDIIKPKVIIFMHSKIRKYENSILEGKDIKSLFVWHCAYPKQNPRITKQELKENWDKQLEEAKKYL